MEDKVQSYNEEALHGQILYFVYVVDETELDQISREGPSTG